MTEEGTAKDAIWLAIPKLKKPLSDFYKLFTEHLSDNNSRIRALKQILVMDKDNKLTKLLPRILKNILADISWEDPAVLRRASPVVSDLIKDDNFRDLIVDTVTGFYLSTDDDLKNPHLKSMFERITTLYGGLYISSLTGLDACKELKNLNLEDSQVKTLKGLNTLSRLESLDLRHSKNLKELSLEKLTQLKTLNLVSSRVKTLRLNTLLSLETLALSGTSSLEDISLENLPQLKTLNLEINDIKTLKLNTLSSLKSFT